jgi:chromosome segregation ATPase
MKDEEPQDLTFLVEQHAKEVWALKQELSKASEELTVLRGTKDVVVRLSNELVKMKKRAQEAEGENTIIKGIDNTSPEMNVLQAKIKMHVLQAKINELEGTLGSAQDINDDHQRYNGKLQTRVTELEGDNKKLSQQIEDKNNFLDEVRKSGF